MTIAPDPAEITPPLDPAIYARRRSLGLGFWAMLALCVLSIAAGVAIATYGPAWWPLKRPAPAPAASLPALDPAVDAAPQPAPPLVNAFAAPPPAGPDLSALEARVATLESSQARTMDAAAAALAAALLAEAAEAPRPFETELAALERVLPMSPDALALRSLAQTGAPTRAALAADFDDAAASAAVAARDPGEGAGFLARLGHALSAIVTIRRVGSTVGDRPDAVLARAERQLTDGDIDGALRTLADLPTGAREAMSVWRVGAERRAAIDRRVASIRARALADLAQAARSQP